MTGRPGMEDGGASLRTVILWSSVGAQLQARLMKRVHAAFADGIHVLHSFVVASTPADASFDVHWFRSFYGQDFYEVKPNGIVAHKGGGSFRLLLLKDTYDTTNRAQPSWQATAMKRLKADLRAMTPGTWQVHAAENAAEAASDFTALFGKSAAQVMQQLPQRWGTELFFNHTEGRIVIEQRTRRRRPREAAALLAAAAEPTTTDATPPHREARAETTSSKPQQAKAKRKKGKKGKTKAKRNADKSLVGTIVHKHYPGAGLHKGKVIKARRIGGAQYYDVLWTDGTVSQLPRADVRRHTVK